MSHECDKCGGGGRLGCGAIDIELERLRRERDEAVWQKTEAPMDARPQQSTEGCQYRLMPHDTCEDNCMLGYRYHERCWMRGANRPDDAPAEGEGG